MPIRYEIRDRVLWFVTEGDVDYEDGFGVLSRGIEEAGKIDPARRWPVIFDIRGSTENRSSGELRGIADYVAKQGSVLSGRCAIVAGDAFHYALGRMFEAYSQTNGVDVAVVRSVDDALGWIG